MAAIDYGVMVFIDGKQTYKDELYPKIYVNEDIAIECYKAWCEIFFNGEKAEQLFGACRASEYNYNTNKKSIWFSACDINFHIREIYNGVFRLRFCNGGHYYTVIYGYGIDPDERVWNRAKVAYLGNRGARIVDKEIMKVKKERR